METPILAVAVLVAAYLAGSVDFAVVVGRIHGVDITSVGSGNPGAANVMRTLGRGPGAMVLAGDMLKGVVAAAMGMVAGGDPAGLWAFGAGAASVLGHCYPVFHRFRGGKGVATAVGVMLLTIPVGGLALIGIWLAGVALSRISAVGSLALSIAAVPVAMWQGVEGTALVVIGAMFLLVVLRHRTNIARLVAGEEHSVRRQ
ncbi:MAG: glycerol-3-phosphate 1-O-acyltransferase PlsY [Actinomycetota bacterium]